MTEKTEKTAMPKTYDPQVVEKKWYTFWEENGFFSQPVDSGKKPFSIVMPPPNVTGVLHLGHAMNNAIQDVLVRFKRMQGYNTLWLPGTDHAGIATEAKVAEQLTAEGTSRDEIGRERFVERTWAWKKEYGGNITRQLRRLGASCDWPRERFTFDEGCSEAVRRVFVALYERGLIYRGNYIINWCSKCHTTISDIEVDHVERDGHLWHIRYPAEDGGAGVVVATTRPETMLGDVAVAVHPEDERYKDLIGKNVVLPLMNRVIPVIADTYVDSSFGTGAVKITPAHDPNDFEMGLRHSLEQILIMDDHGYINENGGSYCGLEGAAARRRVVEDLEKIGLLIKVEEHVHAVGQCYRCETVVEPRVSRQWFVRMTPLTEPAMEAVRQGRIEFVPERFAKIYLGWMENIRDWCISRQLWWGHRIPVWYCRECGAEICALSNPSVCVACGSSQLEQDEDVLDTWFSSALWPFSTMGWPRETKELEQFYPTSVLVTARDIIFFWVARMIFMGLDFMKEVPFHKVMIHGLILDREGRKMSKSLGNGIDPLDIIESHGADTLRFMLLTGNTPGNDLRFYEEKLDATRNFLNKIWNASRFGLMHLEGYEPISLEGDLDAPPNPVADKVMSILSLADRWILSRYEGVAEEVTRRLEDFDLGEAGRLLYEFVWNELCDWYIELAKPRLYGRDAGNGANKPDQTVPEDLAARGKDSQPVPLFQLTARTVLYTVLEGTMRLLHPFLPFLTEEIWQHLPHTGGCQRAEEQLTDSPHGQTQEELTLMLRSWPQPQGFRDEKLEKDMDVLMEVIRSIRNIRSDFGVAPSRKINMALFCANTQMKELVCGALADIELMASCEATQVLERLEDKPPQSASAALDGIQIFVPLKGFLDLDKELGKVEKDIEAACGEEKRLSSKLSNLGFVNKAPADVVAREREKLETVLKRLESLRRRKKELQSD